MWQSIHVLYKIPSLYKNEDIGAVVLLEMPVTRTYRQSRMNVGIPSLAWAEWHHANGGISVTSNNSFTLNAVKQDQVAKL